MPLNLESNYTSRYEVLGLNQTFASEKTPKCRPTIPQINSTHTVDQQLNGN